MHLTIPLKNEQISERIQQNAQGKSKTCPDDITNIYNDIADVRELIV